MGKMQINIGPITNSDGFPLKIEVFGCNVNDHKTVLGQVANVIQLSLFGKELSEIGHEGIRYILSVNPELRDEETAYLDNYKICVSKFLTKKKAAKGTNMKVNVA